MTQAFLGVQAHLEVGEVCCAEDGDVGIKDWTLVLISENTSVDFLGG